MSRIIYENVAVGMILQRIAECRIINLTPNLIALLTQQSPAEKKYRDMPYYPRRQNYNYRIQST